MDKVITVIAATGLSALIIYWFFGKKTLTTAQAEQKKDYQTATITVDGGYKPNVISVQAGKPARITFMRKDSSSCLEEVIMPDFDIAQKLPVNKPYVITIKPAKKGTFTYTCGMRMFSGQIEVL